MAKLYHNNRYNMNNFNESLFHFLTDSFSWISIYSPIVYDSNASYMLLSELNKFLSSLDMVSSIVLQMLTTTVYSCLLVTKRKQLLCIILAQTQNTFILVLVNIGDRLYRNNLYTIESI